LDAKWKEFQRKFDTMIEKTVGAIGQAMGLSRAELRPAQLIDEAMVAQVLRRSTRVVVLTGAGVSAESGIPTFRGADGFWTVGSENYRPEELATWQKFDEMPVELWRWYQYRWGICRDAWPNPGHHALVELEGLVPGGLDLVTQNIDGLHRQAGSKPARLCEIHGRIDEMRCDERVEGACLHGLDLNKPENVEKARATVVKTPKPAKSEKNEQLPKCAKCGVRQRPKILWFDESYNEALYRSKTALEATKQCDVLLIIGTQLTTGLPSRMVSEARESGATLIRMDPLVDLADPKSAGMLHVQAKSGEALPKIVAELRALLKEPLVAPLATPNEPAAILPGSPVSKSTAPTSKAKVRSSSSPKLPPITSATPPPSPPSTPPKSKEGRSASRSSAGSSSSSASRGSLKAAAAVTLKKEVPRASSVSGRLATSKRQSVSSSGTASLASKSQAQPNKAPAAFFVYGTLRPDDDSGASWTKDFSAGLHPENAMLSGASMYIDGGYAAVSLERTRCAVRGVLLSVPEGAGAAKLLTEKLAEADRIEGYPSLYDRTVVTVRTESGASRQAYVYHRTGRTNRSECVRVSDGDWLSRPRKS